MTSTTTPTERVRWGVVATVGVDHTPIGQLWMPRLTTVDTDLRGMMAEISLDLKARLAGEVRADSSPGSYPKLIDGETT